MKHAKLEVGNECKINFWTDVWVGEESLKTKFPNLCNCQLIRVVMLLNFHSNSGWKINFRRNLNDGD